MSFQPYLSFPGTCAEAMTFYAALFGGDLTLRRFAERPGASAEDLRRADSIWHAVLVLGGAVLMASDRPLDHPAAAQSGVMINHDAANAAEAARIFAALATGGTILQPLAANYWSPAFGAVTDRFGTAWMINTPPPVEGP